MSKDEWRVTPLSKGMRKSRLQDIYSKVPTDLKPTKAPKTKSEIIAAIYQARKRQIDKGGQRSLDQMVSEDVEERASRAVRSIMARHPSLPRVALRQIKADRCEMPASEVNDFLKNLPSD